ncbi:MAG TPA: hypothetical protein VIN07_07300 [Flavipsychrobacter sp.]
MDERKVHIDEFFRREMDGHTDTPPPAVWNALEKRLDEKAGRKRPFPIWWLWTIGGLVILSATVIIAGYLNDTLPPTTANTQQQSSRVAISTEMNNTKESPLASGNAHSISATPENTNAKTETTGTTNTITYTKNNSNSNNTEPTTSATNNSGSQPSQTKPDKNTNTENTGVNETKYPDDMPVSNRFRDNINLLSAVPYGYELPVQIPFKPAPGKTNLPEIVISLNSQPVAELPIAATEQAMIQAPLPEMASMSDVAVVPASLSGLPGAGDEMSTPERQDVFIPQSTSQDTSKKKKASVADTNKSILEETVYAVNTSKKKPLPFGAGVKLGFSKGFDPTWYADKFVFAPYVEYGLPSGFSVMLQPAFLIGKAKTGAFANSDQVFYEVISNNFDSIAYVSRGAIDSSVLTPNPPDTVFRTYRYGQVYDSIHVGYKVTNTQQWDVEVPVMVKYKVNKTFAVIAGASATYSSVLRTREEVTRYQGLSRQYEETHAPQTFFVTAQGQEPPAGPQRKNVNDLFPYNTAPFSNYQPRQITETNNFWRLGFMIGASATFRERLMVELMLHKSGVNASAVPDRQLQRIYTQPYLRLMIGYKFVK